MPDLLYVYAVVPLGAQLDGAPLGVDGASLTRIPEGDLAAIVSRVDASYGEGLDDRLADVGWLGPRATAHDVVLTWASDTGPVVPLPLLSLFRSDEAVRRMLRERSTELAAVLAYVAQGREYGVRVFRVDAELRDALAGLSPTVARLAGDVTAATSPGQAYLLGRKLEAARKDELQRVSREVAALTFDRLSGSSVAAVEEPLPTPSGDHAGVAVLNAAFLVAQARLDEFRAVVTDLMRDYGDRGFRIEFTGPWPPYHFTRSGAAGDFRQARVTS